MTLLRRYLTALLLALWMGGFTFYALIVIPTAAKVLGSERQVGFITQQVTRWLNFIGVAVILFFLWNVVAEWKKQSSFRRIALLSSWLLMVVAHFGLFITHSVMDRQLSPGTRSIHDFDHFVNLHTVYLTFATTQWSAALIYLLLLFFCWRSDDCSAAG